MYKSYSELGVQPEQKQDQYSVVELSDPNHKAQVIASHKIVCIDIYADWCGPCKQTASTYAILASQFSKPGWCAVVKYKFENMSNQERQGINGIPIFEFYVGGRKVGQIVGADLQAVEDKLRQLLSGNNNTVVDLRQGPPHERSTIRNNKPNIPMSYDRDSTNPEPYQSNNGGIYHQPNQSYSQSNNDDYKS